MSKKAIKQKRQSRVAAALSYDERYVSFVDILAFSNIVARSENDPTLVGNLSRALHGISQRVANARSAELGMEATAFSDNVVLSVPTSAEGLLHMLQTIGDLSMDLLNLNMLFRGAVVKGKLLHTTGAVFGPALIHAYKLETTVSFHPRIMVSAEVYQDAASSSFKSQKLIPKYIVADQHDVPYLNPFARWYGMKGNWPTDALEKLVTLQTIIATGLIENATLPPVAEKYKWIARRLNSFVRASQLSDQIAEINLEDNERRS
jgi:hypothetical protein